MRVIMRYVGAGQEVVCPTPTTGGALLAVLGLGCVVLANIQPLKGGNMHRTFRRVTRDDAFRLLELDAYTEVYTTDRHLFGRIEAAPPHLPQEPVPQEVLRPARALERTGPLRIPMLHAVYEKLYHTLPWPAPLPRPEYVPRGLCAL